MTLVLIHYAEAVSGLAVLLSCRAKYRAGSTSTTGDPARVTCSACRERMAS